MLKIILKTGYFPDFSKRWSNLLDLSYLYNKQILNKESSKFQSLSCPRDMISTPQTTDHSQQIKVQQSKNCAIPISN